MNQTKIGLNVNIFDRSYIISNIMNRVGAIKSLKKVYIEIIVCWILRSKMLQNYFFR